MGWMLGFRFGGSVASLADGTNIEQDWTNSIALKSITLALDTPDVTPDGLVSGITLAAIPGNVLREERTR